jgi:hypothetical protein
MHQQSSFPDGTNIEDYVDWESWNYSDMAWQYLRRNPDFQRACLELNEYTSDIENARKIIAENYFLNKFKDFREPIFLEREGFLSILSKSRAPRNAENIEFNKQLKPYQVGFVVDLRLSLCSNSVIDVQLKQIRSILEKRRNSIRNEFSNYEDIGSPTSDRDTHLLRLRILDLRKSGNRSWKEIAEVVDPGSSVDVDYRADRARKTGDTARQFVNFGYIALVASGPSRNKMPRAQ